MTAETIGIKPSWHRLLAGPFAADSSCCCQYANPDTQALSGPEAEMSWGMKLM